VQFHPEVRRDQVLGWFEGDETVKRPLDELADELDEKLDAWQEHGRAICRAFLTAARS
jgi:GMP synthase-like glutamine amidotransferase